MINDKDFIIKKEREVNKMVQTIQTKFKDGQIIINNDIDIPNDSPILVSYINNSTFLVVVSVCNIRKK